MLKDSGMGPVSFRSSKNMISSRKGRFPITAGISPERPDPPETFAGVIVKRVNSKAPIKNYIIALMVYQFGGFAKCAAAMSRGHLFQSTQTNFNLANFIG